MNDILFFLFFFLLQTTSTIYIRRIFPFFIKRMFHNTKFYFRLNHSYLVDTFSTDISFSHFTSFWHFFFFVCAVLCNINILYTIYSGTTLSLDIFLSLLRFVQSFAPFFFSPHSSCISWKR